MALTIAKEFSKIEEISSEKSFWNIKAKVIRLWQVTDFNRTNVAFSVEMVLMDSDGGRIHATIKKTLLYKFKNEVFEGKTYAFEKMGVASNGGGYRTTTHPYKLNFQYSSVVQHLPSLQITKSPYQFVPISQILGGGYDTDYLPDVIGVLTGVGQERELEKNYGSTKMNIISVEAEGFKIQCTLFGNYCDELNNFIAAGDVHNAVVIIQLAKAKTFQDKVHLQNCMTCTRLIFNPNCEEARVLKSRNADNLESPSPLTLTQIAVENRVSPFEEFLYNTPRTTIQGLKDATTDSLFVVLGTIKKILNPETFWYTACSCSKAVIPDSQMYFCEKCDRHVMKVYPRFCIKVRVLDNTDCGTMVIFDNDATQLLHITCQDVLDSIPRGSPLGFLPNEIAALVDQQLLFKVETKAKFNTKFEQSFRVRKICNDANIITEFKKKWDKEDASFSKSTNENASLSTLMDKGKQLLLEGPAHVLAQDVVCLSSPIPKLKGKVGDGSASVKEDLMTKFVQAEQSGDEKSPTIQEAKRSSPTNQDEEDMNVPLKLLKRSIKIEKL